MGDLIARPGAWDVNRQWSTVAASAPALQEDSRHERDTHRNQNITPRPVSVLIPHHDPSAASAAGAASRTRLDYPAHGSAGQRRYTAIETTRRVWTRDTAGDRS